MFFLFFCILFFELCGVEEEGALLKRQLYKESFFPNKEEKFKIVVSTKVKAKKGPLENVKCYYKENFDSKELEFLVVWENFPFSTVSHLKERRISNSSLRILFRTAQKDEESESGSGLISGTYCDTFALSGLSFTFGDDNLKEKLKDLYFRIRAGNYEDYLAFKEDL